MISLVFREIFVSNAAAEDCYDSSNLLCKFSEHYYNPTTMLWTQLDPSGINSSRFLGITCVICAPAGFENSVREFSGSSYEDYNLFRNLYNNIY
jgi:hypothetical protein